MKTRAQRAALIVFLLLLIAWMACSTRIVAGVFNRGKNVTIVACEPGPKTVGVAYYYLEACEQTSDVLDTVRMTGYVYNISEATDEQSTRSLIMKADDSEYRIQMEESKSYAWRYFSEFDPMPKKKAGISVDFCPLSLPDHQYSLILQIEEDGVPVVRADTGYVIDKTDGHAVLKYQPSEPAALPPEDELKGWINCGLNVVELDSEGNLNLTGWAIREGEDATEYDVLIGVCCGDEDEMRIYSTTKESITYIADYFDNALYDNAGFRALIPDVTQEGLRIYVFASCEGATYRSSYHFEPDGGLENMVSVSDMSEIIHRGYETGRVAELPAQQELVGWTNGGIDYVELDDEGNLYLSGWTMIDQVDSAQVETLVAIRCSDSDELRVYAAAKTEAGYIADYFGDERYLQSGFKTKIPNVMRDGIKLYLYSSYEGKTYQCAYHFEPSEDLKSMVSVSDADQ